MSNKKWVDIPISNLKSRITYILKEEHYIRDYMMIKNKIQGKLRIFLNYNHNGDPTIQGLKRISTPGRRVYVNSGSVPRVLNGMGTSILTTSKGVMSNKKAKKLNVGGEVLCQVW